MFIYLTMDLCGLLTYLDFYMVLQDGMLIPLTELPIVICILVEEDMVDL